MRHAFLIIAHNNFWQLKQLIRLLDSELHDIYVHIDKRCKNFDKDKFSNITSRSRLFIFQEHKVYWGGFSQVEVELFLLGKAYDNHYDYYHIISGADLPIKTNSYIDSFFEKNNGLEFIDFDDEKLNADPEISRRTRIYHLLQNLRRISPNKHLNNAFIFCERVLLLIQIILRVDRTKKLDWTIKYGSQWVSITDGLVKEILSKKAKIRSVFKYTNCADELFIQTVAYNSDFRHKIYKGSTREVMNNMRIVDWKRGKNGSPYTFREDDFSTLGNNDALFARKFSQEIDKSIIVKITDYLEDGVTA